MRRIVFLFLVIFSLTGICDFVYGADTRKEREVLPVVIFYDSGCTSCDWVVKEYLPRLKEKYGDKITVEYYDTSIQENFEKKLRVEEQHGIVAGYTPEIFIAGKALLGESRIRDELEDTIHKILDEEVSEIAPVYKLQPQPENDTVLIDRLKSFRSFMVAGAGLLDGINPCAFSTIIFFLSFLVFAGFDFRKTLFVGISFTLAVFLTYLGLGFGVFSGLERLRIFNLFSRYFDVGVGGLVIIFGLASLYDYVCFKKTGETKGMLLRLPGPVKNIIHRTVRIIKDKGQRRLGFLRLLAVAFLIGVIVSLLESVCTGQIYLPTITFILKMKTMWWQAFLFLLLYNVAFILPLVIVLLATLLGVNSQWWSAFVRRHLGMVKLVTAMLFFFLGGLIIFLR